MQAAALRRYAADLHVHLGRAGNGQAVKITAARDLTLANVARECLERKGLDLVGIADCASPSVQADLARLLGSGELEPLAGGGLRYRGQVTVILGAEFETRESSGGLSHHLGYFPDVASLADFSAQIGRRVTNVQLSSQSCGLSARQFAELVERCGGVSVPAHAFTPHKSLYGACAERAAPLLGEVWERLPALELGLSADAYLADRLAEAADKTFLSNSDAHSLPKIAREYNLLELAEPTYAELLLALQRRGGRRVAANCGLDPRLGKYHRTCCEDCGRVAQGDPPLLLCESCGSERVVRGVLDRICAIADYHIPNLLPTAPPYRHQVPLEFMPGVGPVAMAKLLNRFGTEMAVLHEATEAELGQAVGSRLAAVVVRAREGRLVLQSGGGGSYGRAQPDSAGQLGFPALG